MRSRLVSFAKAGVLKAMEQSTMMRQIAIGLAVAVIAAATSTLSASAKHYGRSYHAHAKTFGMSTKHGKLHCRPGIPSCYIGSKSPQ
jgi:hypothetical protein